MATDLMIPFKIRVWKDAETKLWLAYSKRFEISAYGRTKSQALAIFKIQVEEILVSTKPKPPKRKLK